MTADEFGPYAVGVYETTPGFRDMREMTAVCEAETGRMVAVTGPAYDEDYAALTRLFAAAPELLAALRELTDAAQAARSFIDMADDEGYEAYKRTGAAVAAADAAIAKAQGV